MTGWNATVELVPPFYHIITARQDIDVLQELI
jgi:hypothetical protein